MVFYSLSCMEENLSPGMAAPSPVQGCCLVCLLLHMGEDVSVCKATLISSVTSYHLGGRSVARFCFRLKDVFSFLLIRTGAC